MTQFVLATQRVIEPNAHGETREGLDIRWREFFETCGLILLPAPNDPQMAVALAEKVNFAGLLLTGGGDLVKYGGSCLERESTEDALFEYSNVRDRPVFGVCRGMQYLLDRTGVALDAVAGHTGGRHRLSGGGNVCERDVNSAHNLGSRDVGDNWVVEAAADDVVEAVRHNYRLWRGVMWHPEREVPFHPHDVEAFSAWFRQSS